MEVGLEDDDWDLDDDFIVELQLRSHFIQHAQPSSHHEESTDNDEYDPEDEGDDDSEQEEDCESQEDKDKDGDEIDDGARVEETKTRKVHTCKVCKKPLANTGHTHFRGIKYCPYAPGQLPLEEWLTQRHIEFKFMK